MFSWVFWSTIWEITEAITVVCGSHVFGLELSPGLIVSMGRFRFKEHTLFSVSWVQDVAILPGGFFLCCPAPRRSLIMYGAFDRMKFTPKPFVSLDTWPYAWPGRKYMKHPLLRISCRS